MRRWSAIRGVRGVCEELGTRKQLGKNGRVRTLDKSAIFGLRGGRG